VANVGHPVEHLPKQSLEESWRRWPCILTNAGYVENANAEDRFGMKTAAKRQVVLLNYADDRLGHEGAIFKRCQQAQSESALAYGVDSVVSWDWEMLASTTFYQNYKEYLERPCRLNGFVFKPYLTLRTLDELKGGDILIYTRIHRIMY
jgi:hypothetical protein